MTGTREFFWPVRIYYEDTDSAGLVYYANYLRFMERSRTEWLRSLGFEQDQLLRDEGLVFAVRSAEVDFRRPGRFNDLLNVGAAVVECGKASLVFRHRILRECDTTLLCSGRVKVACLNAESLRPTAIPGPLLQELRRAG